ncbi:MAG: ATP-binding protein [Planctomycetota bacterium]|nr:ATP-binding protein [Planctomycetota bacterium]MDI6787294.1 ATP-binding protein [Planctomycetota bacterium]
MRDYKERLVINSDPKHLELTRNFIRRILKKKEVTPSDKNKIILSTDEALSNVIEHAYEFNKNGCIDINIFLGDKKFRITILHGGKEFDPLRWNKIKDISLHIKEGKKRGLGIFLMRLVMDEVKYSFKNGINQLTLIKYLTKRHR